MLKRNVKKKILAMVLIFTLTFAKLAYVTEAMATSIFNMVFNIELGTGHENVEFEAYFDVDGQKENNIVSDVNNTELAIKVQVDVLEYGYLKHAKVELVEAEEGKGLNFKVRNFEELPINLQNAEDNVFEFKQINDYDEISELVIPIDYKNEEYINENKLTSENIVRFTGIYVDDDGKEINVSKDVALRISWKDSRDAEVTSTVEKYIDFKNGDSKGVILQTLVKVDNFAEGNTLPVRSTEVTVEVPKINEVAPNRVEVIALSTMGTNGKFAENVVFGTDNWSYDSVAGTLNIKVENQKELVVVEEYADEFLKELEEEIVQEERYYSVSGCDEFLITYTYQDVELWETMDVPMNVTGNVELLSGEQAEPDIRTVGASAVATLTEQTGDIVSYDIENETVEISKTYTYLNYNTDNNQEIEYRTKNLINVSYKDIIEEMIISDVGNEYVLKDGNVIGNDDTTYKEVSLDRANMIEILGEEGKVEIFDEAGNLITAIDNQTTETEDGKVLVGFDTEYRRLVIKTTKPIAEGLLVINTTKVSKDANISREEYKNASSLKLNTKLQTKYTYVDELVEIGTESAETNLVDTVTGPVLKIDRDSLSTLSKNENVEIRIELNNDKVTTDPYGNSVFEVIMPEYVENVELTNSTLAYAEGLEITNAEVVTNEYGRKVIKVTITGKQETLNTGVLTNGTNIELYANIDVNIFAPAKNVEIELKYTNEYMTAESVEGKTVNVNLSAPTGLVAVNSTSNYNELGTTLTSVRQGIMSDLIDIYVDAKVATMDVIVMNNNGNTVSNLAVLGRIPFKGVKDVLSGNDLGTTLDTKFVTGLVSDPNNNGIFNVYYSENGEATKDLDDPNNGWTLNPENLSNMKSYLIIPEDSEYVMDDAEMLKFTYQYEIPGQLPHNEDIYGTFLAYYTNNSDIIVSDETSAPDIIGLTTGEGPELEIAIDSNVETVSEFEQVKITSTVKNAGEDVARDVVVKMTAPGNISLVNTEASREGIIGNLIDGEIVFTIPEIAVSEELELSAVFSVNEQKGDSENKEIVFISKVNAKDLGAELKSNELAIKVNAAELAVTGTSSNIDDIEAETLPVGFKLKMSFTPENLLNRDLNNVVVTAKLPDNVTFQRAYMAIPTNYEPEEDESVARYDEGSRTVTWTINKLNAKGSVALRVEVVTADVPEGAYKEEGIFVAEVKADGTKTYKSNEQKLVVGKTSLSIHQETLTDNTYVKEGDDIKYKFVIRNDGSIIANDVMLKDVLSDGLYIRSLSYRIGNGNLTERKVFNNDAAQIALDIPAETTAEVIVTARARTIGNSLESTVENYGKLSEDDGPIKETNKITHIVEADESATSITDENRSERPNINQSGTNTVKDIVKTYKVSGTAWLDGNGDGARGNDEERLSGVSAMLVNAETGVIVKSVKTDSKGEYNFAGVENGNYLVVFDYDTVKYTVTTYQKNGVEASINSDALTTKLEQSGKQRNGAVTDVITVKDSVVGNIDIGFIYADTFDLTLEKAITKITVQNAAGTTTNEFDYVKLAQAPIAAKHLSTSTVYIEYKFKVSNIGDISGYAKKIVDYIPEGMTFVSDLNPDWYTGTDGNLYTTALEDVELVNGESRELTLVLEKKMTEENTGIVNNRAEIYEDYNIYGVSDSNSVPANNAQGENDLGLADAIITVRTGEVFVHISVIITTILLGGIVIFIAYHKIVLRRKKGGV